MNLTVPTRRDGTRLHYLPGLDGLRAVAVAAVLLYHADLPWIPGGYLGVEVFFALSGYLITSLLVSEWRTTGGIDLRAFWLRRARRLLPALFVLLAAVLAFAVLFLPEEVASLRGDALAAGLYVTNWYQVIVQRPYFEIVGRPPMLQHLWSLAVEEQFYLLWPLLFAAMAVRWKLGKRMLVAVLVGAAASAALMALLYVPDADPSRIYYGTDTRASGLLLGCALALAWSPSKRYAGQKSKNRWKTGGATILRDLLGLVALGTLVYLFVNLSEDQSFLYQGGFVLTAVATLAVILACAAGTGGLVPWLLGLPPVRWIGTRSYGIYLWHWPVYAVTRPQLDLSLDPIPVLALRLGLTLGIAELSYRLVETPVRRGALGRAWHALRTSTGGEQRRVAGRWLAATASIAMFAGALVVAVVKAEPPAPPDYLATTSVSDSPSWASTPPVPTLTQTHLALSPEPTATAVSVLPPVAELPGDTDQALPGEPPTVTAPPSIPTIAPSPTSTVEPPTLTPSPVPPTATHRPVRKTPTRAAPTATATHLPSRPATASPTETPVEAQAPPAQTDVSVLESPTAASGQDGAPTPADMTPVPTIDPALLGLTVAEQTAIAELPPGDQGGFIGSVLGSDPTATTDVATPLVVPTRATGELHVFALGDSVMLGAVSELRKQIPGISIDAAVSRQVSAGLTVLRNRAAGGALGDVVVIHLGSNGTFSARQFDDIMKVIGQSRRVVFVNDKVPRVWEASNDAVITAGVARYDNAALLNWRSYTANSPSLFTKDGFHLQPPGARLYAQLIAAAVYR